MSPPASATGHQPRSGSTRSARAPLDQLTLRGIAPIPGFIDDGPGLTGPQECEFFTDGCLNITITDTNHSSITPDNIYDLIRRIYSSLLDPEYALLGRINHANDDEGEFTPHVAGGPRVRAGTDIDVDSDGLVHPPSAEELDELDVHGLSTYGSVDSLEARGLTGQVRAPNKELPEDLGIIADGAEVGGPQPEGHRTIYPKKTMPYEEFVRLVESMEWKNIGHRLR